MDKIYRRATQRGGTEKKPKNEKNRRRNVIMNFRVSQTEKELIEKRLELSGLAHKYLRLEEVYGKLQKQNTAIHFGEERLEGLEQELKECKGFFKGKKRKELQSDIDTQTRKNEAMKKGLSNIAKDYGFPNVQAFLKEYNASKSAYDEYKTSVSNWEAKYGEKPKPQKKSVRAELRQRQEAIANRTKEQSQVKKKDRGAR